MEYTIQKLASLAGVSTRTLRWYDQLGLLKPRRVADNGYRIYGGAEVDRLQQILFYRALGVELTRIGAILDDPEFDRLKALKGHLNALQTERDRIDSLIQTVQRTITTEERNEIMSDQAKFEGFKQKLIENNEKTYGDEIRKKYGDETVDAVNVRVKGMSEAQWEYAQELSARINETLKEAFEQGDPASELAQKVCEMHREWLCLFWKEDMYSKEAHKMLAEGYVADERFTAYYDKIAVGCTKFLRDAINVYCS